MYSEGANHRVVEIAKTWPQEGQRHLQSLWAKTHLAGDKVPAPVGINAPEFAGFGANGVHCVKAKTGDPYANIKSAIEVIHRADAERSVECSAPVDDYRRPL